MSMNEVDLSTVGNDVEKACERLLLRAAELTKECRGIRFSSDELLANEVASEHADPFVIELLRLNKALAELAMDTASTMKAVVESIPTIRSSEKTRVWLTLRREKESALAKAGLSGARSKHSKPRALKAWAEQQAKAMKGAELDIARRLAAQIPEHLADVSKNPERLIYEHLRARRNTAS
ncbi:hypothetical protein [Malikia spinosa]|uniref:hypothetical protein n=1 Tax=Malikia spinosa TaxID=86180 RepID=UPI003FA1C222